MEKNNRKERLKLDQIMKVLFKLSKKVMIDLMNGLFDEDFKHDEVTIKYENTEFIKDDFERIIGDIFISICKKTHTYHYHVEFQTTNDNSMVIRMFQYGFEKAYEINDDITQNEIKLDFPKQMVIFIEENENIADELSLVMSLPDGNEARYTVPTMKYWNYSIQNLQEKKMYALLPLQVFKSRKKMLTISNSKKHHHEKAQLIAKEFDILLDTIKLTIDALREINDEKEIYISDLEKILRVIMNITDYLYTIYGEYSNIDKEVYQLIRTLYDPAVELNGKIKGKIEDIIELLEEVGTIPKNLKEKIHTQTDLVILSKLHKLSAKVKSIKEFEDKINQL